MAAFVYKVGQCSISANVAMRVWTRPKLFHGTSAPDGVH